MIRVEFKYLSGDVREVLLDPKMEDHKIEINLNDSEKKIMLSNMNILNMVLLNLYKESDSLDEVSLYKEDNLIFKIKAKNCAYKVSNLTDGRKLTEIIEVGVESVIKN